MASGSGQQVSVRRATRDDVQLIHDFIVELQEFEGVPCNAQVSVSDLIRDGFESEPTWFFGLVVEVGGVAVGHALVNRAYSSSTGRSYYLEDLYVRQPARRLGVGLRLLQELSRMAVEEGVSRVDWQVLESNTTALAFYERLGARNMRTSEGRAAMRLDRTYIEQLARDLQPRPA